MARQRELRAGRGPRDRRPARRDGDRRRHRHDLRDREPHRLGPRRHDRERRRRQRARRRPGRDPSPSRRRRPDRRRPRRHGATGDGTDTLAASRIWPGPGSADRSPATGAQPAHGAGGDDTLIGARGDDDLQVARAPTPPPMRLAAPIAADLRAGSVTGDGLDTLAAVENVTGSDHGDTLAGDAGANVLDGGSGLDTISFAGSPQRVDANLATGLTTGDGADTSSGSRTRSAPRTTTRSSALIRDTRSAGGAGNDTCGRRRQRPDHRRGRPGLAVRRGERRRPLRRRRRRPPRRWRRRQRLRRRHGEQHLCGELRRGRPGDHRR